MSPLTGQAISTSELRKNLSDHIADVIDTGAPICITRHGQPVAALVSYADLLVLQRHAEGMAAEAEKAMQDKRLQESETLSVDDMFAGFDTPEPQPEPGERLYVEPIVMSKEDTSQRGRVVDVKIGEPVVLSSHMFGVRWQRMSGQAAGVAAQRLSQQFRGIDTVDAANIIEESMTPFMVKFEAEQDG